MSLIKTTEMQTSPPEKRIFTGLVNQWVIYDRYMSYEEAKEKVEEIESAKEHDGQKPIRRRISNEVEETEKEILRRKMMRSLKMLERMVNQNNHNEISLGNYFFPISYLSVQFLDFKFYEDQADEFKENEGTLLPLWSFTFEKAAALENTGLGWNPAYSDLFAASYGSCIS